MIIEIFQIIRDFSLCPKPIDEHPGKVLRLPAKCKKTKPNAAYIWIFDISFSQIFKILMNQKNYFTA